MKILAHTRLYFTEGRSDKEYHVELAKVHGGHVVNFRFGRRGGTLTSGTKTATPVDLAHAKTLYDRLTKDKTAKGYTPDGSGAAYQNTEHAGRQTGFMLQLLNPITEYEATMLLANDSWAAQEKMDGERRMAEAVGGQVTSTRIRGAAFISRSIGVPVPIWKSMRARRVSSSTSPKAATTMRPDRSRHSAIACRRRLPAHAYLPKGTRMPCHNSPLESLAAFAIVFATGVISTVTLAKYVEKIKRDAVSRES